jgi:hypothetical protein
MCALPEDWTVGAFQLTCGRAFLKDQRPPVTFELLEIEVKKRLEATRDELGLSSLSATITYLIDNLPGHKREK